MSKLDRYKKANFKRTIARRTQDSERPFLREMREEQDRLDKRADEIARRVDKLVIEKAPSVVITDCIMQLHGLKEASASIGFCIDACLRVMKP